MSDFLFFVIIDIHLRYRLQDFVLIQRKKGADSIILPDEERLLFKDKDAKSERYLLCTKRTAVKPEQLAEAAKAKKKL
tara:strand:- start:306 stop:539 length:234 start_codon:yes stop_codon:yes gene_type:complete